MAHKRKVTIDFDSDDKNVFDDLFKESQGKFDGNTGLGPEDSRQQQTLDLPPNVGGPGREEEAQAGLPPPIPPPPPNVGGVQREEEAQAGLPPPTPPGLVDGNVQQATSELDSVDGVTTGGQAAGAGASAIGSGVGQVAQAAIDARNATIQAEAAARDAEIQAARDAAEADRQATDIIIPGTDVDIGVGFPKGLLVPNTPLPPGAVIATGPPNPATGRPSETLADVIRAIAENGSIAGGYDLLRLKSVVETANAEVIRLQGAIDANFAIDIVDGRAVLNIPPDPSIPASVTAQGLVRQYNDAVNAKASADALQKIIQTNDINVLEADIAVWQAVTIATLTGQIDLDFKTAFEAAKADIEIQKQLALDNALRAGLNDNLSSTFFNPDGSFNFDAAAGIISADREVSRSELSTILSMPEGVQRGAAAGAFAARITQQFPLPNGVSWDGTRFILPPDGVTDDASSFLGLIKPIYSQSTAAKKIEASAIDANLKATEFTATEAREAENIRRQLATDQIDSAEEAEIRRTIAETERLNMEPLLFAIEVARKIMSDPFALAIARRSGFMSQLEDILGVRLPQFWQFSNTIQAGSLPSLDDFNRADSVEKQILMTDWMFETGSTSEDFLRAIQSQAPGAARTPTRFSTL